MGWECYIIIKGVSVCAISGRGLEICSAILKMSRRRGQGGLGGGGALNSFERGWGTVYCIIHGLDRDLLLKNFNANNSEEGGGGSVSYMYTYQEGGGGIKWIVNTLKFEIE